MGKVNDCGFDSRGTLILDNTGGIIEDYSQLISNFNDYKNKKLKESQNFYILKKSELVENILVPSYYDLELMGHVNEQNNNKNKDFVSLGELEKSGHISIKNVPASTSKQNYGSGEISFIRTTDIANGEVIYPTIHSVSKEVYNKYKDKQDLKEFDILFVKDGTYMIGNTVILFKEDLNSVVQSHFKIIRVLKNELINPFLLFYLLQTDIVKRQINKNVFTQATLSSIGNRIYNIKIPLSKDKKEISKISSFSEEALTSRNKYKHKFFREGL